MYCAGTRRFRAGRALPHDLMTATELECLTTRIRACRVCVEAPRGRPMPHEPRPVVVSSATARILIAGQAPGTKVHATGIPFNDASGDRLRDWLGVSREEFYDAAKFAIVPMGFCFPGQDTKGGDLPPRRECAPLWRQPLIELMPQIDLVLTIGLYAQQWHLREACGASLGETVRNWRAIFDRPAQPRTIPLPHPSWRNTAWLKKNPWFEAELLPVLKSEIRDRIA